MDNFSFDFVDEFSNIENSSVFDFKKDFLDESLSSQERILISFSDKNLVKKSSILFCMFKRYSVKDQIYILKLISVF